MSVDGQIQVIQIDANEFQIVTGLVGPPGQGVAPGGTTGQILTKASDANFDTEWETVSGTGTVTDVSVVTHAGVSGTVANPTTAPAISISLGAITPSSVVASGDLSGANLSGTNTGDQTLNSLLPDQAGQSGKVLSTDGMNASWATGGGGGSGTVTDVSVVTHAGVSGTVATSTTTPAISLTLGAITPSSVNASGTVTGSNVSGSTSGTNTGDQTITLTGDVSGSGTAGITTAIGAGKVTNSMLAGSIAASKLVGTDITTVGTVSTGTWNATTIAIAHGGTGGTTANAGLNNLLPSQTGNNGKVLSTDGSNTSWAATTTGTVTTVSVTTANGVSGIVANPTSTPAITLTLGAITPSSVAASGTVTGSNVSGSTSGTNTGDQTITLTGNVTGSGTGSFATTIGAGVVTNTMLAGSIAASKLVGTDITTVGTVSTGTWNATTIAVAHGGTGATTANAGLNNLLPSQTGNNGKVLQTDGTNTSWQTVSSGSGTVTDVSVTTANGVSGTVATSTTTPAITLTLGDITPNSVAATSTVTGSNLSGTNTGDQTLNSLLPSQSGEAGKVLSTDGTNTSWATGAAANVPSLQYVWYGNSGVSTGRVYLQSSTDLYINQFDQNGADMSGILNAVASGAEFYCTSRTNAAVYIGGSVTGNSIGGGVYHYSVSGVWSNGSLSTGDDVNILFTLSGGGGGSGTVTDVSVSTVNGVSGIVASSTTTPTISISLGDITPNSVAATSTVTGSNLSGTNTGDQTITLTGDVTGSGTGSFATTIGSGVVTNSMLAGSIAASKLVGTDITTVGTIATGTWAGTTIAIAHGGTGQTTANAGLNALLPTQTSNAGKVLQTDGTNTSWATAGGGGWSPYPPFTPTGIDDDFSGGSFSGWTAVGTSPTPTVVQTNHKLSILHPGGDSASKFYSWVKSATVNVGDWLECCFRSFCVQDQYPMFAIIFADGNTYGAGNQVMHFYSAAQAVVYTGSFTGFNALGGYVSPSINPYDKQSHMFLRMQYTAANTWTGQVSCDGTQWSQSATNFSRTLTPTYVGFGVTHWGGATYAANWSLEYIRKYS